LVYNEYKKIQTGRLIFSFSTLFYIVSSCAIYLSIFYVFKLIKFIHKTKRAKKLTNQLFIGLYSLEHYLGGFGMVVVRNMRVEDAETVAQVTLETIQDAWDHYERDCYPRKALEFDLSLLVPEKYAKGVLETNEFYFVAEENGKVVGVVTGTIQRGNENEGGLVRLGEICVHPNYQRKGIGKTLLNRVVEYSKEQKCHKITLYTLPVLIPALNLYIKLGFVPEAYLRKEWWGVDFIKMSRWL
jgi:ribosomal protein S18 acetylase RimI-like enzyme